MANVKKFKMERNDHPAKRVEKAKDVNFAYTEDNTIFIIDPDVCQVEKLPHAMYEAFVSDDGRPAVRELKHKIVLPEFMLSAPRRECDYILESFKKRGRATGVIWEGTPGSGKTFNAKYLASVAIRDYPVVFVPDTARLEIVLPAIKQILDEAVIIIDEIDKKIGTFGGEVTSDAQVALLSFLDGLIAKNFLTIMTANKSLPSTFTARPGRVRYYTKMHYLKYESIVEMIEHSTIEEDVKEHLKIFFIPAKTVTIDKLSAFLEELEIFPDSDIPEVAKVMGISTPWYTPAAISEANEVDAGKFEYDIVFRGDVITDAVTGALGSNGVLIDSAATRFVEGPNDDKPMSIQLREFTETKQHLEKTYPDMNIARLVDFNVTFSRSDIRKSTDSYIEIYGYFDYNNNVEDPEDKLPAYRGNDLFIRVYLTNGAKVEFHRRSTSSAKMGKKK